MLIEPTGLLVNVLVTLGCIFIVTRALPKLARWSAGLRSIALGVMLGATALASMLTAFPIDRGIFGDMRSAVIAVAALCGGPVAAVICTTFAVVYRIQQGGHYVGGVIAILLCAALSISFWWLRLEKTRVNLWSFGLALALLNSAVPFIGWLMGTAPLPTVVAVAETILGMAIVLYPISIVILVGLVTAELARLDTESGLRAENAELSVRERRFLNVFEVACVPMAWIDLATKKFIRVNPQYELFTGYSAPELMEMTLGDLSVPEDRPTDLAAVRALATGTHSLHGERRYLHKDGSIRWGNRTLTLSAMDGEPKLGFAIVEDITERKLAEQRIAHLAEHDHLTGLANRPHFSRSVETALGDPNSLPVAVLVMDLDDFKVVNDTRGHPVGDRVLVHIAELLHTELGGADEVARIGGDEFAIIRRAISPSAALEAADRLIALISSPFDIDGLQVKVQATCGIAVGPSDGVNTEQLFKRADIALYAAKAAGKGLARLFDPSMEALFLRRERLKTELARALAGREFEVEYQPVVDVASGRVCRFEALLRWNHPSGDRPSPAEFVPVAEETGAIVPIGDWVLRHACLTASTWPDDIGVAVNVSVRQFEPALPLKIAAALLEAGLSASRLVIEITESVLMNGSEDSLALLSEIRALGVHISLDDFGTGYSSMSYLQRFPFDQLKIDRSFVSGPSPRDESRTIVRSIIELGHSLGMTVTAEGVETADQLNRLRKKGCDAAQGYLFSRSVPAEEIPSLLARLHRNASVVVGTSALGEALPA